MLTTHQTRQIAACKIIQGKAAPRIGKFPVDFDFSFSGLDCKMTSNLSEPVVTHKPLPFEQTLESQQGEASSKCPVRIFHGVLEERQSGSEVFTAGSHYGSKRNMVSSLGEIPVDAHSTFKTPPSIKDSSADLTKSGRRALTIQVPPASQPLVPSHATAPRQDHKRLSFQMFSPLLDPVTSSHFGVKNEVMVDAASTMTSHADDDAVMLKDDMYLVLTYERERDQILANNKDLMRKLQECQIESGRQRVMSQGRELELKSNIKSETKKISDLSIELEKLKRDALTEKSKEKDLILGLEQLKRVILAEKEERADLSRSHHQLELKRDRILAENRDLMLKLQEDTKEQKQERDLLNARIQELGKDLFTEKTEKEDSLREMEQAKKDAYSWKKTSSVLQHKLEQAESENGRILADIEALDSRHMRLITKTLDDMKSLTFHTTEPFKANTQLSKQLISELCIMSGTRIWR